MVALYASGCIVRKRLHCTHRLRNSLTINDLGRAAPDLRKSLTISHLGQERRNPLSLNDLDLLVAVPCEENAFEASEFSLCPRYMSGASANVARGASLGEHGLPLGKLALAFCDLRLYLFDCHNFFLSLLTYYTYTLNQFCPKVKRFAKFFYVVKC